MGLITCDTCTYILKKIYIGPRFAGGVAFIQNLYGYPALISLWGKSEARDEGEILLLDSDDPKNCSIIKVRDMDYSYNSIAIDQLGDNIVIVEASSFSYNYGQDILVWDYGKARPKIIGQLSDSRIGAQSAVVSGRFFQNCKSIISNKNILKEDNCYIPLFFS